jgi:4-carboxymuconolactone decarboxylase
MASRLTIGGYKMARLPQSIPTDPNAKQIYDKLLSKRGRIDGMYLSLLNHPSLAEHIGQLGSFLRFEGTLPGDIREVTILCTAFDLGCGYEWVKHIGPAQQAGVPPEVIDCILSERPLSSLSAFSGHIQELVRLVINHQSIPQVLQDEIEKAVGMRGIIELVALIGFYSMIAGVITAFNVSIPPGESDPFLKAQTAKSLKKSTKTNSK